MSNLNLIDEKNYCCTSVRRNGSLIQILLFGTKKFQQPMLLFLLLFYLDLSAKIFYATKD